MIKKFQERLQHATDSKIRQGIAFTLALLALNIFLFSDAALSHGDDFGSSFPLYCTASLAADVFLVALLGIWLREYRRRKQ